MNDFAFYFREGLLHIADWKGYDHILFVAALCLPYLFREWKRVLIMVTAFTLGHSVTLALSVFERILVSSDWIEFLIPVTILVTAVENLLRNPADRQHSRWRYGLALVFGLVHGLGFSNYLKSMLGKSEQIVTELLAFNLGLEAGQLLIVALVLLSTFLFVQVMRTNRRDWLLFISGGIFSLSLVMALERIPF
ncbi:MAG TPA: HupE/UreJ family protein [Lacibacter sp.]|nr:HupE/UreJ family protein [Lacibacter sp.]HMO89188.1 HupE/UreJ family protein [Lacibacter sp.]HMP86477.1 HupE/UreJ family protein [Lacibacter sp.]